MLLTVSTLWECCGKQVLDEISVHIQTHYKNHCLFQVRVRELQKRERNLKTVRAWWVGRVNRHRNKAVVGRRGRK